MTVTRDAVAPRKPFSGDPLGGTVDERLARLPEVVAALRRDDPAAERDRVLQYDAVEAIRRTGVLNLRVPTEFGGPGGKARDVLSAVIQIGRGSSNVAQALRSHFGFSERLLSNRATRQEAEEWFPRVYPRASSSATRSPTRQARPRQVQTPRCCPTPTECCGSTATSSIPPARCSPMSSRYQHWTPKAETCRRSFLRTGPVLNCSTIGTDSGSEPRPAAAPGSPTSRCFPTRSSRCPKATHSGHATAFLQLYLAAVAVGIAYAVFEDAVEYVRTKARPASHSVADSAATDPFVLEAVGEISAAAASAEAIVLTAADAIDRLVDYGQQSDPDALADVAVAVARAQLIAERLTISAAGRLFDTGGASATARALNLDRHWRNARTIAGHSPLAYKAYAAGDYAVNGTWPAANGYF